MLNSSVTSVALTALVGLGALLVVAGPGGISMPAASVASARVDGPSAVTVLRTATGDEVGRATFTGRSDRVAVDVTAQGLQPGFHGFHVHSVGQCNAPDFASAGSHFTTSTMDMGMSTPMHAGDLPSLLVNEDGTAQLSVVTDRFSIEELLAGSGTALVVHAGPDNFANIPTRYAPAPDAMTLSTGDAGARIACGVIQATAALSGAARN